jgi:Fe-S-cluster containining protein
MAVFVCNGCGKCCLSFGAFIAIERQLNPGDYYCRYGITNELFLAHVQPEFVDAVADEYEEDGGAKKREPGKGCIFLRKDPETDRFLCAIYPTRPAVCRAFRCYRMLIYQQSGEPRGKVIGAGDLRTEDKALREIWQEKIAGIPRRTGPRTPVGTSPDYTIDREWFDSVIKILAAHGYRGELADGE